MRYLLLFLVLVALPTPVSAMPEVEVPAALISTAEAPKIDGVLDDPIWQRLDPITDFRQREPVEGAEATERTEVRIAYDADHLYFGFIMHDREPAKVRANVFDRGGRIDKDDRVIIALDTYHDRRNAYIFEINPLGTQDDALLTDEQSTNWNWDCVYYSEGRVTERGWELEVAIPFSQIRFAKVEPLNMGVAIMRTINRKNETAIWPYISPDFRMGIFQVSQYAALTGLHGMKRGRHLEIKPYLLTGAQTRDVGPNREADIVRDVGVDVKYGVTSNLTLDLTLNTDFAQVEADNAQINLTRFNLFFPEKREFFLERAGLFTFGNAGETEVFFSRRIGITNDILAGARLTGQAGPVSLGLLNIQTKQEEGVAGSNHGVARVRADVHPRATVGGLFANLEGPDAFNRALGVDGTVRLLGSSRIDAWFANVWDTDKAASDAAGSLDALLRNDRYSLEFGYTNVGTNFQPAIGFVRRLDMIRYRSEVGFRPLVGDGSGFVRRLSFFVEGEYIEGQDHEKQSTEIEGSAFVFFRARDHAGIEVGRAFERLEAPFLIRPDVEIVPGDYTFDTITFFGSFDQSRRLYASLEVEAGSFFDGTRTGLSGQLGFRFSKHLKMEGLLNHNIIALPFDNGDFSATVAGLTVQVATSRKLFANALVQYDNFSKALQANVRVNWIHTPGSDLFLVFNTGYVFQDRLSFRESALRNRAGVAKVTYLITL